MDSADRFSPSSLPLLPPACTQCSLSSLIVLPYTEGIISVTPLCSFSRSVLMLSSLLSSQGEDQAPCCGKGPPEKACNKQNVISKVLQMWRPEPETRDASVVHWLRVRSVLIERVLFLFLFLFSIVRKKNIFTVPGRRKNTVNNRGEIIV